VKEGSLDRQYDMKDDHTDGASEVNPVMTGWDT